MFWENPNFWGFPSVKFVYQWKQLWPNGCDVFLAPMTCSNSIGLPSAPFVQKPYSDWFKKGLLRKIDPPGQIPLKVPNVVLDFDVRWQHTAANRYIEVKFSVRFEMMSPYHCMQMSILRFWCICIGWQHAVPNVYIKNFTSKLNLRFGTCSGICPWPNSHHFLLTVAFYWHSSKEHVVMVLAPQVQILTSKCFTPLGHKVVEKKWSQSLIGSILRQSCYM